MPVKYLSQEWIEAYNATTSASDAVAKAMKGKSAVLQMVIAEAPQGEVRYWLRIGDGTASVGLGEAGDADVTISQSYDTAAKVDQGELDGPKAFTQGKVKIAGKMLKMMQLRGPLADLQKALAVMDVEY
jgi:putative sterol carrier protein